MLEFCSVTLQDFECNSFPKEKIDLKSCDTFYFTKGKQGDYEQLISCASQDKNRIKKMIEAIISKQLHSFSVAFEFKDSKTTCYQLHINDKIYHEICNYQEKGLNHHQILLNLLNNYSKDYKTMVKTNGIIVRKTNSYYLVPTNSSSKTVSLFCTAL